MGSRGITFHSRHVTRFGYVVTNPNVVQNIGLRWRRGGHVDGECVDCRRKIVGAEEQRVVLAVRCIRQWWSRELYGIDCVVGSRLCTVFGILALIRRNDTENCDTRPCDEFSLMINLREGWTWTHR